MFILFGCSNIRSVYVDRVIDLNDKSVNYAIEKAKAKNVENSIIYFTNGFVNDTIELVNGNKNIFKLPIETIDQLGLAKVQTVDNTKEVKINIKLSKPLKFVLNPIELKKHKFIYISRVQFKNKIIIEYTNIVKRFL
jgi:hypothetical protein